MKKADVIKKYAKALRKDKIKSYLLAICGGVITWLMYKVGVQTGTDLTYKAIAEICPEDSFVNEDEKASKDAN